MTICISDGTALGEPCSVNCGAVLECTGGVCVCPVGELEYAGVCCKFINILNASSD